MTPPGRRTLYTTFVALRAPPAASPARLTPAQITDLMWAHAAPASGFEHVTVLVAAGRIEVAVFVLAASSAAGRSVARRLCTTVVERCGVLDGWTVTAHRVSDVRRLVAARTRGGRAGTE